MIEIRTLHVGSGALSYSPEVGSERFWIALMNLFIALPQGFRDDAGHRLTGGLSDGFGEPGGFRVFDVEAHGVSFLLYHLSTSLDSNRETAKWQHNPRDSRQQPPTNGSTEG